MKIIYSLWAEMKHKRKKYLHDYFTFRDGDLREAIEAGRIKECFVAFGPNGGVQGWAGLYKYGDYKEEKPKVGVFVRHEYRHQGIGKKLKDKAIQFALETYGACVWHRRISQGVWHLVARYKK